MSNDVVEAQLVATEVSPVADEKLVKLAEQVEQRIDAMVKIKRVAIKLTNASDWSDQNGKPYLETSGAEKIARMFGITWGMLDKEPLIEYEESGHFMYTYRGIFQLAGASIEVIGTRSSKDGFFTRGGKIPITEIDKGDVKKSAYTNMVQSGVTRILGIRNMTWEELADFAKITQDHVKKIDYKKAGKAQDKTIASEGAKTATFIPKDIRKQTGTNKKTNKPWTKYIIKSPADTDYGTFSETFAGIAKEAKDAGRQIAVTFKETEWGNDAENVVFADDGPQEREPGSEG